MKYLVVIVALLFFACGNTEQIEAQLSYNLKTFSSERCIDDACAKVEVSYPIAEGSSAAAQINENIMRQMLLYFNQEEGFENLDSAANDFLDSYEEFITEFPEASGEWSAEVDVELTYESDSTLSFKFSEFNFSGGAHPNSSIFYVNMDKQTGESLGGVILDEKKMLELTEAAFRKYHEVEEGVSLEEDGRFFLPETGFFLPNAIGYEGGKMVLIYIPYEIGPYALGYTEMEFELTDLKGIVRLK